MQQAIARLCMVLACCRQWLRPAARRLFNDTRAPEMLDPAVCKAARDEDVACWLVCYTATRCSFELGAQTLHTVQAANWIPWDTVGTLEQWNDTVACLAREAWRRAVDFPESGGADRAFDLVEQLA